MKVIKAIIAFDIPDGLIDFSKIKAGSFYLQDDKRAVVRNIQSVARMPKKVDIDDDDPEYMKHYKQGINDMIDMINSNFTQILNRESTEHEWEIGGQDESDTRN